MFLCAAVYNPSSSFIDRINYHSLVHPYTHTHTHIQVHVHTDTHMHTHILILFVCMLVCLLVYNCTIWVQVSGARDLLSPGTGVTGKY